jgi:hypothetical protein
MDLFNTLVEEIAMKTNFLQEELQRLLCFDDNFIQFHKFLVILNLMIFYDPLKALSREKTISQILVKDRLFNKDFINSSKLINQETCYMIISLNEKQNEIKSCSKNTKSFLKYDNFTDFSNLK